MKIKVNIKFLSSLILDLIELMKEFESILEEINDSHIFIDFAEVKTIDKDDYEQFDQFFLTLKKKDSSFACFNMADEILDSLLINTSAKQDDIRVVCLML